VKQIQNLLAGENFGTVIEFVRDEFVVRNIVADRAIATLV